MTQDTFLTQETTKGRKKDDVRHNWRLTYLLTSAKFDLPALLFREHVSHFYTISPCGTTRLHFEKVMSRRDWDRFWPDPKIGTFWCLTMSRHKISDLFWSFGPLLRLIPVLKPIFLDPKICTFWCLSMSRYKISDLFWTSFETDTSPETNIFGIQK